MPAPFASRNWHYKGQIVRTLVDDDGAVHVVLGDISRILASEDPDRMASGLDGHEDRPHSGHPPHMFLVGEGGLKALLRDSRGSEARPLGEWLESVVMPTLRAPGRHGNGTKTPDPILSGLKALTGLRAAQLSRDRHLTALAEAVGLNENAALAISPPAGKTSMTDLIAWCQTQGVDLATRFGTTTASPHEGGMSPLIDTALKTSSSRPSMHQPDVTDGNPVEERDEDGAPAPKVRKMASRAPTLVHKKVIEIDPLALYKARKAAVAALVVDDEDEDEDDEDAVSRRSAHRPARGLEEPTAFRQLPINGEDQLKALQAITLSKDKRKD